MGAPPAGALAAWPRSGRDASSRLPLGPKRAGRRASECHGGVAQPHDRSSESTSGAKTANGCCMVSRPGLVRLARAGRVNHAADGKGATMAQQPPSWNAPPSGPSGMPSDQERT